MNFVGSKNGAGMAQWLISLMPPHRVYVEAFLGKGVILRTKLPAAVNIGIERDLRVVSEYWDRQAQPEWSIVHGDALTMLQALRVDSDWLIYADPPYLMEARSCKRNYYGREFSTEEQHRHLLSVFCATPARVMISGYQNDLYSMQLSTWRTSSFWTVNRRGKRVQEFCWMNFPAPEKLHDPRFAGTNFTDRQRIKRKVASWQRKFGLMTPAEQSAILRGLSIVAPASQTDSTVMAAPDQPALL